MNIMELEGHFLEANMSIVHILQTAKSFFLPSLDYATSERECERLLWKGAL